MKIGLAITTTGDQWDSELLTVQLSSGNKERIYDCKKESDRKSVISALCNDEYEFIPFNGLFDLYMIFKDLYVLITPAGDAHVMALMNQISDPTLEKLAQKYLKIRTTPSLFSGSDDLDSPAFQKSIMEKARLALSLESVMTPLVEKQYPVYKIELKIIPVLIKMRLSGLIRDPEIFDEKVKMYRSKRSDIYEQMVVLCEQEFNVKNADLDHILHTVFKLSVSPIKTGKGAMSFSQESLAYYKHEWVDLLLKLKAYDSILRMVPTYSKHDVYHMNFKPLNESGSARIYTENPSINQIPKALASSIVPAKGKKFVYCDWSGAELILLSYSAGQNDIILVYESGGDIHRFVASKVLGIPQSDISDEQKEISKIITFSIVYGSKGGAASRALQIDYDQGEKLVATFMAIFTKIKSFQDSQVHKADRTGLAITMIGRRRSIDKIKSHIPKVRAQGERQALNTPIQNGLADFQKLALIRLDRSLPSNCRIVFTWFDSFLFEIPQDMDSELLRDKVLTASTFKNVLPDDRLLIFNFSFKEGYDAGSIRS